MGKLWGMGRGKGGERVARCARKGAEGSGRGMSREDSRHRGLSSGDQPLPGGPHQTGGKHCWGTLTQVISADMAFSYLLFVSTKCHFATLTT